MHVLPIVTRGPTENVNDLLYLKGVDAAIINSDALEEYKSQVPQIQQRIAYILNLFPSELHVFVRPEIRTLADLAGKKVNFNTQGTAAAYSGPLIFSRLGISVEKMFIPHPVALEQLKRGEIAAVVFVTTKPVDAFVKGKWEARIQIPAGRISVRSLPTTTCPRISSQPTIPISSPRTSGSRRSRFRRSWPRSTGVPIRLVIVAWRDLLTSFSATSTGCARPASTRNGRTSIFRHPLPASSVSGRAGMARSIGFHQAKRTSVMWIRLASVALCLAGGAAHAQSASESISGLESCIEAARFADAICSKLPNDPTQRADCFAQGASGST